MLRPIKFNLSLPTTSFALARSFAEEADRLGFYSVSMDDHLCSWLLDPRTPHLECYMTLASLAVLTRRVKLAQLVTAIDYRNPALLAKMTSTLDRISEGRVIVGVGAGWSRSEYRAYCYPYVSGAQRFERLREAIAVLKVMWTEKEPSYQGNCFTIEKAYNQPPPVQKPHPPLLVGGSGKAILRIAAAEADICNLVPPARLHHQMAGILTFDRHELKRRIEWLRGYCVAIGRPVEAIELSTSSSVFLAEDRSESRRMLQSVAAALEISDIEALEGSCQVLAGTPTEVTRELRTRIEQMGTTYFMLSFMSLESVRLFAKTVMPAFT